MEKPIPKTIHVYDINNALTYMEVLHDFDLRSYDDCHVNVRSYIMELFYLHKVQAIFTFARRDIDIMRTTLHNCPLDVAEKIKAFIKFLELLFIDLGEPFHFELGKYNYERNMERHN